MFHGNNVNAYSPEGRILQLEYACEASKLGPTSFGICTKEAVILASEKRVTPLMVAGDHDKIVKVYDHIYCTISGLSADARSLIAPAREKCINHWLEYNEILPIASLMATMARQTVSFGMGIVDKAGNSSSSSSDGNDSSGADANEASDDEKKKLLTKSRPYGVALLFGGCDLDHPELWHLEPTGEVTKHGFKAIGSSTNTAESWLNRHYQPHMNTDSAISLALSTIQVLLGEQRMTPAHLDLIVIKKGRQCHQLTEKELDDEIIRRRQGAGSRD